MSNNITEPNIQIYIDFLGYNYYINIDDTSHQIREYKKILYYDNISYEQIRTIILMLCPLFNIQ